MLYRLLLVLYWALFPVWFGLAVVLYAPVYILSGVDLFDAFRDFLFWLARKVSNVAN